MAWFLLILFLLGLLWTLGAVAVGVWLGGSGEADERHPVQTEDGWTLTLHRYRAAPGAPRRRAPVLLGHGINMNRAAWELSDEVSLPRALAARGFDVWVADYRSTRSAVPPRGEARWRHAFEDLAYRDLPALIEGVCALTGAPRVSWVGHSMGGILAYLYAGRFGGERLDRLVTLGSPSRFGHIRGLFPGLERPAGWYFGWADSWRVRWPLLLAMPAYVAAPRQALFFPFNHDHVGVKERVGLVLRAFEDNATSLPSWFLTHIRSRASLFPTPDPDRPDAEVAAETATIDVPLLVLAGANDRLAPPAATRPAYEGARSPLAAWKVYGGPGSSTPAFGHCDLISSRASLEHVLPDLESWLGDAPRVAAPTLHREPSVAPPGAG